MSSPPSLLSSVMGKKIATRLDAFGASAVVSVSPIKVFVFLFRHSFASPIV